MQRALAKEPDKRFPDATRMRMMLGGILAGMNAQTPQVIGEAMVPLGGEVVAGYVDVTNAPVATPLEPRRVAAPVPLARPAALPRETVQMSTSGVPEPAKAANVWKVVAIGACVCIAVLVGLLLTQLR